jgi:methyl-accepting chemotaxis protein/hemerythrin
MSVIAITELSFLQTEQTALRLAGRQTTLVQQMGKDAFLFVLTDSSESIDHARKSEAIFNKTLKAFKNSGTAPETLNLNGPSFEVPDLPEKAISSISKVDSLWNDFSEKLNRILGGDKNISVETLAEAGNRLTAELNKTEKIIKEESHSYISCLATTLSIFTAIIVFTLIFLTYAVVANIIKPLRAIRFYTGKVAEGDFAAHIEGKFIHELLNLKNSITTMTSHIVANMREVEAKEKLASDNALKAEEALEEAKKASEEIKSIMGAMNEAAANAKEISEHVFSSIGGLSQQVHHVNGGVGIQRDRLTETATAMEQMNNTVYEVARSASNAAESAEKSKHNAQVGAEGVQRAVTSIEQIKQTILNLKETMSKLGEQADNIGQIMNVITDIADQTNLLALNAAIEAARAGDAGRGFAVVADEVRKLAEKTMDATKEVGTAVSTIQDNARENITAVEAAADGIVESTKSAAESGKFMEEIVGFVEDTANQVASIATASEEQSAASEQINRALSEVTEVASETADGMEESAKALGEISSSVEELDTIIQGIASGQFVDIKSGKIVEWTQDFAVNVRVLDEHHQTLFKYINELYNSMKNRKADTVMSGITEKLVEYTKYHFGYEEKLFNKYGYPETESHKKAHRMFVDTITKFDQDLKAGKATVSNEIIRFLKEWLIEHILKVDTRYSEFLNSHGVD